MAVDEATARRAHKRHLSREALLEETGPSGYAIFAVFLIAGLLAAAVAWSYHATITKAAKASGEVVPSGAERVVQHFEGGIVREISVKDGDLVRQGQVLIRFDPTLREAELDQVRARAAALTVKERRYRAFIDGGEPDFSDLEADYPNLVQEGRFTLQATRERVAGQEAVLESRITQRQKTVDIYRKQEAGLKDQVKLVEESVAMRDQLFKKGLGSRVNLIGTQLDLARVQGALTDAQTSREQALVAIDEARNQLEELRVTERGDAMEELSAVLAELAEVRENLKRLQDRVQRLDVRAPVDGLVHRLAVNTAGAVVEPAQVLMSIVPVDETVIVEARLDPKDIGHLKPGQAAKVAIGGFDARRYGVLPAKLQQISATSFTDSQGTTFFKGRIVLDSEVISGGGSDHRIVPGMTAEVDIVLGSQTLLEYITGPVYKSLMAAFSER